MSSRDPTPLYKLIVLGDGGVGKTALTIQLCLNHFVETYDPTIEDSYRTKVVVDGEQSVLEVLDTAGQEEYTALRDQWIRDGEGFVLVYSITSRSSFTRIRSFYNQIQRAKEDSPDPFAVVIVGNKSDRSDDEREVSTQEGEALAQELGNVPFFESSAKYNINTETSFLTCATQCKRIRELSSAAAGKKTNNTQPQGNQLFNESAPRQNTQQNSTNTTNGTNTGISNKPKAMAASNSQHQAAEKPPANSQAGRRSSKSGSNQKHKKDKKCSIM